jgi:hypothetical protein
VFGRNFQGSGRMSWQDILKAVSVNVGKHGKSIMLEVSSDLVNIEPLTEEEEAEGWGIVSPLHVTLLGFKDMKVFPKLEGESNNEKEERVRGIVSNLGMSPPSPKFGDREYYAERPDLKRESKFLEVSNQLAFKEYVQALSDALNMEAPVRYFHLTTANIDGGNSFKSIGDITEADK